MFPRYLYSFTSSIFSLLKNRFPEYSLPNTINFVLVSLTITLLFAQKCLRPLSCFWSPFSVFENNIRSSAHSKCAIIISPIQIPASFFKYISKSLRYFLNKIPLATPPWLTPVSDGISGLSLPPLFTLKQVLEYKSLKVSITRPLQPPFIILKNNMWRFTRSNALEKSTKHTYI